MKNVSFHDSVMNLYLSFTDVDECVAGTNPCSEKGKCINLPGSFRCECSEGWEGLTCETSTLTYHADINQKTY